MTKPPFPPFPEIPKAFSELQDKVSELLRASPAAGVEKQVKSAFSSAVSKMDVVTREDFELQQQMLAKALEKLAVLERRVAEMEALKKP